MTVFTKKAHTWWDEQGPFQMLHRMNPLRLRIILNQVTISEKIKVLDVGCGGGLMSEPLARLGARVTGLDLSQEAIDIATEHAKEMGFDIEYKCSELSEILDHSFDLVMVLEMLEHVDEPEAALKQAVQKLKIGGTIVVSTINKTFSSYIKAIKIAETFGFAPKGAHQWSNFLKPSKIILWLESLGVEITDVSGMTYSVLKKRWETSKKIDTNYIVSGKMVGNTGFEPVTL